MWRCNKWPALICLHIADGWSVYLGVTEYSSAYSVVYFAVCCLPQHAIQFAINAKAHQKLPLACSGVRLAPLKLHIILLLGTLLHGWSPCTLFLKLYVCFLHCDEMLCRDLKSLLFRSQIGASTPCLCSTSGGMHWDIKGFIGWDDICVSSAACCDVFINVSVLFIFCILCNLFSLDLFVYSWYSYIAYPV